MNFLPFKTVYTCAKGTSTSFTDLALSYRSLTLRRDWVKHRFQTKNYTAFRQISVVPCDTSFLPDVHRWQVFEGRASLLSRIKTTLKATILEHWMPDVTHVFLHSSGFDSRCLSWLVHELYHEHGPEWLGDVLFICSKWEAQSFLSIMKYQEWPKHCYYVPYQSKPVQRYYETSLLDFDNAWRWSDGAIPIPVNLYWYPIVAAIEDEYLDGFADYQIWTGRWGNTVLDAGSSKKGIVAVRNIVNKFYNSILCQRPLPSSSVIDPYATEELAKVVCESSLTLDKRLRPLFCEYLDPALTKFPNLDSDGDRHRPIAPDIISKVVSDYRSSWYGQTVHPDVRPVNGNTEFHGFWYHWSLASFCEELRRRGIKVK